MIISFFFVLVDYYDGISILQTMNNHSVPLDSLSSKINTIAESSGISSFVLMLSLSPNLIVNIRDASSANLFFYDMSLAKKDRLKKRERPVRCL